MNSSNLAVRIVEILFPLFAITALRGLALVL